MKRTVESCVVSRCVRVCVCNSYTCMTHVIIYSLFHSTSSNRQETTPPWKIVLSVEISFILHLIHVLVLNNYSINVIIFSSTLLSSIINRLFHSCLFSSWSSTCVRFDFLLIYWEHQILEDIESFVFSLRLVIDVIQRNILICSLSNKSTIESNQISLVYFVVFNFPFHSFCSYFRSIRIVATIAYVRRRYTNDFV